MKGICVDILPAKIVLNSFDSYESVASKGSVPRSYMVITWR